MSDARTDFFKSDTRPKQTASRDDFFAGKVDTVGPKKAPNFSAPYAYFDPEVRRAAGVKDSDVTPLQEIPAGFNRGTMELLGLPMNTAVDASNLLGAGYGTAASEITGRPADEFFSPYNKEDVPLTGSWFSQKLDALTSAIGMGPVTQPVAPEKGGHQLMYNIGSGIPSSMVGGGGAVAPGMAGTAAGAIAGQAGADPAMQAVVSLLASHGASKLMEPPAPSQAKEVKESTPQEKLNEAASKQSMGAAGAAVDLDKLSPDLKNAVTAAVQKTGGAVNPEVLARRIQADSLPVKVPMSEGQALGDARIISMERNDRGRTPGAVEAYESQNKALTENLKAFRDMAGEDVFSTNPVEHGDTLIAKYKAIDDARNADITQKYQALQDAAGGDFPIDTQALNTNVIAALKKKLATNNAPSDVMSALDEAASSGKMSLEDFENLRSTLAREQRTNSKGEVRYASGVIRNEIEKIPLQPGAEQLKGLADTARAAARERFQALEADPAYKASVEETVSPDAFVSKFITGKGAYATREQAANMAKAMADDPTAQQTLKVAVLDHLRQSAGIDPAYNGNFSQAGYNKALNALSPRIEFFLDPALVEHTHNLGDVARYSQFQPSGSFVNNSNTFVSAAADKAKFAAEKAVNMSIPGLDLGTMARERIESAAAARRVKKTWDPGAGLTKLSDLSKMGKEKK